MQATKIIQVVILMLILALAASCAAGKQYSARVFGPRVAAYKESQQHTIRFLTIGDDDSLDEVKPILATEKSDSVTAVKPVNETVKPVPLPEPVAKTGNSGGIRTKRTRNDQ